MFFNCFLIIVIHFPGRVVGTSLNPVEFAKLASALQIESFRITGQYEFEEALQAKGPVVIEVMTNPEQISVQSTITSIREGARQKR